MKTKKEKGDSVDTLLVFPRTFMTRNLYSENLFEYPQDIGAPVLLSLNDHTLTSAKQNTLLVIRYN